MSQASESRAKCRCCRETVVVPVRAQPSPAASVLLLDAYKQALSERMRVQATAAAAAAAAAGAGAQDAAAVLTPPPPSTSSRISPAAQQLEHSFAHSRASQGEGEDFPREWRNLNCQEAYEDWLGARRERAAEDWTRYKEEELGGHLLLNCSSSSSAALGAGRSAGWEEHVERERRRGYWRAKDILRGIAFTRRIEAEGDRMRLRLQSKGT
ncbi:hypothetical protein IE81DRAFT_233764 [Ceraceosorus guamensis]|uniref:Uncharacterized protein n=1 Tax=Ceraceosorus guamensis TaxID=1522189 RepID=A0A316VVG3_9BASI|nr:hypothetical protein IE81DRAFT_233764 [Ceraceosorus guamensis]PWN40301.1 hypothetical protein IE81DRAFT_233764 [Ceraceosorus guamensis]